MLEFLQNKLGDYKRPFKESRIAYVNDPSINDNTGVDYLGMTFFSPASKGLDKVCQGKVFPGP